MTFPSPPAGTIAVIFTSQRRGDDDAGYSAAAAEMETLAAAQPGYVGFVATRGGDGLGLAISYWASEAAAVAWRDQVDHAAVRDRGRSRWYERYSVSVATVSRSYDWSQDQQ